MATLSELLQALTGFQAENAYQALAGQLAALGQQEAMTNIDYERQLPELGYAHEDAIRRLHNALANRGTLQSGMGVNEEANLGRQYTGQLDALARQRQAGLANISTQRVNAEAGYNQVLSNVGMEFAGKSTEFIAQQMAAAAERAGNQQQIAYQNSLNTLNEQNAAAQQNFYKSQQQSQQQSADTLKAIMAGLIPKQPTPAAPTTQPTQPKPPSPTMTSSRTLLPSQSLYNPRPSSSMTRSPV